MTEPTPIMAPLLSPATPGPVAIPAGSGQPASRPAPSSSAPGAPAAVNGAPPSPWRDVSPTEPCPCCCATDGCRLGIDDQVACRNVSKGGRQQVGKTGVVYFLHARGSVRQRQNERRVTEVQRTIDLIRQPGAVVEIRVLKIKDRRGKPYSAAGYFKDSAKAAQCAIQYEERKAEGIYLILNEINSECWPRSPEQLTDYQEPNTSDKDIVRRRWLFVDCDPQRPAGVCATDPQVAAAGQFAEQCKTFLREEYAWPDPVEATSGNGHYLLYAIDLPNDEAAKRLLSAVLLAIDHRAQQIPVLDGAPPVKVDQTAINAARIVRLIGTRNAKGHSTEDQPHRHSRIIAVPSPIVAVTTEQLQAVADDAPQATPHQSRPAGATGGTSGSNGAGRYDSRLKLPEWLTARGIEYKLKAGASADGRDIYILARCPFDASHGGNNEVSIMQDASGKLSAKCMHDSCSGRGWQEFKTGIGAPDAEHYDPPLRPTRRAPAARRSAATGSPEANGDATPATGGDHANEEDNDPHRLARVFLFGHWDALLTSAPRRIPAERIKLRYWRESWYEWDGAAYREVPDKEVRARLAADIKEEFDRLNLEAIRWERLNKPKGGDEKNQDKEPPKVLKVTGKLVADTLLALAGITMLPSTVEPPTWISGAGPFPATDVLAAPNALVNLHAVASGTEPFSCAPTLDFFTLSSLDYDFDPNAPAPLQWLEFLGQLWPDDQQSIDTLQEFFGYFLTCDTSLQKILMLVGPMRGGKGTIARILRALVGWRNVAGPTLASLATNFGLWPLTDKSVAIISDARLSHRTDAAVLTERLLSISGEDAQTVDRKHKAHVTAKLPTRFVILTNELPKLNDPSGALVGRLIVLRLTRTWYGKEDANLTNKLLGELPGILLWAIAGWKRLRERGRFLQPNSSTKLIGDLEDLSSPIGVFLRDRCVVGPGLKEDIHDLFEAWKNWCVETGQKEYGDKPTFCRDLRTAVPTLESRQYRKDSIRVRCYEGLRLKTLEDRAREAVEDEIADQMAGATG